MSRFGRNDGFKGWKERNKQSHLYDEVFDEENVYLELRGFQFECSTSVELSGSGVPGLTVKLPRAWAEKLGLITLPRNEPLTVSQPGESV